MGDNCCECVKVPATGLVSLRAIAHEIRVLELATIIRRTENLLEQCLSQIGWNCPPTQGQLDAIGIVPELVRIQQIGDIAKGRSGQHWLLTVAAENIRDSASSPDVVRLLSAGLLSYTDIERGSLYPLVEFLAKRRILYFIPAEHGTFCKWGYDTLSAETEAAIRQLGESYEFDTGTDGDYVAECTPEFTDSINTLEESGLDKATLEQIRYTVGGVIATKKRMEYFGAFDGHTSVPMASLSFDLLQHSREHRDYIVRCALYNISRNR